MKRKLMTASLALAFVLLSNPGRVAAGGGSEHGHDEEGAHEHEEEGVVTLSEEAREAAHVEVKESGPATLRVTLKVNGRIEPVSSKVAHIAPRFAGIIRDVKRDVGDYVNAGELLAVVESNQSLQAYEVRASKPGFITDRHATVGESVQADEPLFIVMDLSQVWADFTVFQRDAGQLKEGQPVTIHVSGRAEPIASTLHFISPVVDEATQSRIARAVVSNPDTSVSPGAFITAEILTGSFEVPVSVLDNAIQSIEGQAVVFVADGDRFEKRVVKTGRADDSFTEIVSGLKPGERYAAGNSFILKAELGKGEAEHED